VELSPEGTPLGTWRYDPDEGAWIFEEIPRAGVKVNPRTSDNPAVFDIIALTAVLAACAAFVIRRGQEG
jgi:hypothetical protein